MATHAWPKLAEHAAGFKNGAYVRVEGRELRSRECETDNGTKVRTYVILASSIMSLRRGQRISSGCDTEWASTGPDEVLS